MEQKRNMQYYLEIINNAPSYQDLVFFRNATFDAIEATLPENEVDILKQAWTDRAKNEEVPVLPKGPKRDTAA